jgi:prepilin-type N-terminal cleavage/methylation domain-containing protein
MNHRIVHIREALGGLLTLCAAAVLGIAGLFKLYDIESFFADLSTWTLVPDSLIAPVALAVAIAELCVLGLWIVPSLRRTAGAMATVMLILFAAAYRVQVAFSPPAGCACFGALTPDFLKIDSANALLVRNGVLAACAIVGCWLLGPFHKTPAPAADGRVIDRVGTDAKLKQSGFTLLEVIVVVALIGVLIAMSVPLLNDIRNRGRFTAATASARSHATVVTLYATDHKDIWPYPTVPKAARSVIRYDGGRSFVEVGYFDAHNYWVVALADAYYDGRWMHPSFRSALRPATTQRGNDYNYPCAFVARPEYYNASTRISPPDQLGPTRASDVVYSSGKALILDLASAEFPAVLGVSWRVFATVDASAGRWRLDQLNEGMRSGDGPETFDTMGGHWPGGPFDLLHSIDGVRGRDIVR